jgi:ubiquinone/menaquinone biosynthesis C-methylase UbiE
MLAKARLKRTRNLLAVELIQGDAQTLLVDEALFDAVILNLILSVIPDGNACLQSALRALKPKGRAVIFDKFLPEGRSISLLRKFINLFSTLLGTDINRRLSGLMKDCPCIITHDEPSIGGGMYRVVMLNKT